MTQVSNENEINIVHNKEILNNVIVSARLGTEKYEFSVGRNVNKSMKLRNINLFMLM